MEKSIWTFKHDYPRDKWTLYSTPVLRETAKYVFVERSGEFGGLTRFSKKQVCFSMEEALERFISVMEQGIMLKERRIQHMKEGLGQAKILLEINRKDESDVPSGS
jgi:hypothetical protein